MVTRDHVQLDAPMIYPDAARAAASDRISVKPFRRELRRTLVGFAALLSLVAAMWMCWSSADDVTRLPVRERRALYERTLDTLGSFCEPSKELSGLDDFCHQQAALLRRFPECGASCRARSEHVLPVPSR
jgi:hypothetical protein